MDPSHESVIGKIRQFFHVEKTASFVWRITNYPQFGSFASPTVKIFNMVWYLAVHSGDGDDDEDAEYDEIYLFSESSTSEIRESLRFTIVYEKGLGIEGDIVRDGRFPETSKKWGPGILPWEELYSEVSITCKVWKDELAHSESVSDGTETEDASCSNGRNDEHLYPDLKGHFRNLLLSGDHHDFLIKVGDKEFRAHKCVLARSPVFAAMFRSQMKESADHIVTIDDCDADAFAKFLQYVYTGDVDIPSTGNALGLYYAGDKYDCPRLKEICVQYLKTSLTPESISDVITLAATHDEKELMRQGIVYISKHLEEVMLTVEWQRFCSGNPIQAHEICLKAVQCLNERYKKIFSFHGIRDDEKVMQ